MSKLACPYCDSIIEGRRPDKFRPCPACGYNWARISCGSSGYLIIDSQFPNLIDKYKELQKSYDHVIIDRRIVQNPIAGADRRR